MGVKVQIRERHSSLVAIGLAMGLVFATGQNLVSPDRTPWCTQAVSSTTESLACGGPPIPSAFMGGSGRVAVNLFTDKHGNRSGNIRTYRHGTLTKDSAGHGGSVYKLYWRKSGGYYSLSATGVILRWRAVPTMAGPAPGNVQDQRKDAI